MMTMPTKKKNTSSAKKKATTTASNTKKNEEAAETTTTTMHLKHIVRPFVQNFVFGKFSSAGLYCPLVSLIIWPGLPFLPPNSVFLTLSSHFFSLPIHSQTGYGSLICPHSRAVTVSSKQQLGQPHDVAALPVVVKGLERTWTKRTTRGMTAMGVLPVPGAECVGVLVPVTDEDLGKFDQREQGYDRVQLDFDDVGLVPFLEYGTGEDGSPSSLFLNAKRKQQQQQQLRQLSRKPEPLDNTLNANDLRTWVYVQQNPQPPTDEHPIVQSYVDTILRGCLSISEDFAKEFILTTKGWSHDELEHVLSLTEYAGEGGYAAMVSDSEDDDEESDSDQMEESSDDDYDETSSIASSSSSLSAASRRIIPSSVPPPSPWVDDRHDPVYIRGDKDWSLQQAPKLDRLLRRHRPRHFQHRRKISDV